MDKITSFIQTVLPADFDWAKYAEFLLILAGGMLVIGLLGHLIFGKRSNLNDAVSAAIAILFLYVLNVVIYSAGLKWSYLISPLPFVTLRGDYLTLFDLTANSFQNICQQILNLVVLTFVMNLIHTVLPKGKKALGWYFWRFLSVILAFIAMYFVNLLINAFVPAEVMLNAPIVLLIILIVSLLLGALKLLVGGVLAFVDPILAILYTFFFATVVGKQLSKAILTAGLLTALVYLMNSLQIVSVYIATAALTAYIPLLIVALILWYIIGNLL
jgi:hypothetical protein